ncbi:hypothetical protein TNCV_4311571 [Trichonephila clavipes]|nr:hypothetical protein TNCV_4311571 [Trichonephila clavipes]
MECHRVSRYLGQERKKMGLFTLMKNQSPASRIPSSRPITAMPLSRMQKLHFRHAQHCRLPDMGLRTVLQSGCPNRNAYST